MPHRSIVSSWRNWYRRTDKPVERAFKDWRVHGFCQFVAIAYCFRWWWHTPTPGKAVTALAIAAIGASIEGLGLQRVAWLVILILFARIEFHAIDKDRRDFANQEASRRADENRQFDGIANRLKDSIKQNEDQFQKTMSELTAAQSSVDQLRRQLQTLQQQVEEEPLASMSPNELIARAREAAQLMRDYCASYQRQAWDISNRYDDYLEGHQGHMTQKQIDDWIAERNQRLKDLTVPSEVEAEKIITTANRLRGALLKQVPTWKKLPDDNDDNKEARWFENPKRESGKLSLLDALDPHAAYLNNLAVRATPSD